MEDERRVREWFALHGGRFGLGATGVTCRSVLNLGGFANRSFAVGDGRRSLHVKLGAAGKAPALLRWARLHRRLEAEYRAPRLLGLVEGGAIAGESVALVFESVPGRALDARRDRAAVGEVLALAARLHADAGLADLMPAAAGRTCADDLVDTYVERLRADLLEAGDRLREIPFVESGFAAWAADEVESLARGALGAPAMASPALCAVHGDLHGGNVLVDGPARWWVLDWDDLHAGGDGAGDAASLLWPLLRHGGGADLLGAYARAVGDPAVPERVALYRRAMLLDEVVDSLADWLEADALPARRDLVRALKRVAHLEALARYRSEYGAAPA